MKKLAKKHLSGGTVLLISLMLVNSINFVFNAYLGRVLTFEEFGLVTLVNTFLYIAIVLFNALSATVNYKIAYFFGKDSLSSGWRFLTQTNKRIFTLTLFISLVWLMVIPFVDTFFQIHNLLVPLLFTPIITLGALAATNKGFLQGNFNFRSVSYIIIAEAVSKLFFAWLLVSAQASSWVYTVIPSSIVLSFVLSFWVLSQESHSNKQKENTSTFPQYFFIAAIITGLSSTAFLTFDLLLVKHFFSPAEAGQYASLSLIGKMVYFFGTLPNALMLTYVSNDEGSNRDPRYSFYKLFAGACFLSLIAFGFIGSLGGVVVPLLLGEKTVVLLPYLIPYVSGIALFALTVLIVSYHLAKRQYLFPILSIFAAVCMSIGIIFFHTSIQEVTYVIFYTSLASFSLIGFLHILEMYTSIAFFERRIIAQHA